MEPPSSSAPAGDAPPPVNYEEPAWAGKPSQGYFLEVLKNGTLIETIALEDRPFYVIGTANDCV